MRKASWPKHEMPAWRPHDRIARRLVRDRKSTRLNSSHSQISYAVFCLKKKNNTSTSETIIPTTHVHGQSPTQTHLTSFQTLHALPTGVIRAVRRLLPQQ